MVGVVLQEDNHELKTRRDYSESKDRLGNLLRPCFKVNKEERKDWYDGLANKGAWCQAL